MQAKWLNDLGVIKPLVKIKTESIRFFEENNAG